MQTLRWQFSTVWTQKTELDHESGDSYLISAYRGLAPREEDERW
jgi:hypothetical protein